ncbi:MAG: VWA domain-containing protein [Myxococcota bacterium]
MTRRGRLLMELLLTAAAAGAVLALLWPVASADTVSLGGRYELLQPRMLLFLAVAPVLAWVASRSLADLPRAQRWLAVVLRAALIGALALALARPVRTSESARVATVVLVDVSDSVPDPALEDARRTVRETWEARGEEDDVHVVTFAREARVATPGEDGQPPEVRRHDGDARAGAGSNVQAALQLAYGLFPPDHLRRVLLLSDGGQTDGDLLSEAERADRFGVRLFHRLLDRGAPAEVAVRDLSLPDRIEVGKPFHVRARLFASQPTKARLRLYQGRVINGLDGVRDVELARGETEVTFRSVVRVAGPVTYRLEVEPQGDDRFAANNRFEASAVVPGKPRVLYVEGAEGRAVHFARALTAAEFDVDVRSTRGMPESTAELGGYDFYVLSDVSADRVSLSQLDAIERYVRDGGGFLMAGGESAFGLGGWQGTRMERLLPVRMDAERRRDQPTLALSLVIDKSGSMNGQKIELAKEAAKATAEMLGPDDHIAVIGFDSQPSHVVRMQSARNRLTILRSIGRLAARGGTAIFPALDTAYQDLSVTRARIKHTILLTDGQSPERGIRDLAQVMRAEGMTVSTIGLGADVNRTLLQEVANVGGGRAYFTNDPHHIPRIFMKETSTVARSAAVDEYFRPRVVEPADFLEGIDLGSAPYLRGYVATKAKPPPAQVILQSDLGEPILARWRVGLGWVLAWTSDVKSRWAADWLRWPGFSQLWAQLIREHMRQDRRTTLPMQASIEGGEVRVVVDAIDEEDQFVNGLRSEVRIEGPMGAPEGGDDPERIEETHPLRQTAPGRYEARFPLHRHGSFVLTAAHRRDDRAVAESSARLNHPYPREYLTLEPDRTLLAGASQATGGGAMDDPSALFDPAGETVRAREDLWPPLLFLALALFLVDLLLRRVRLFDRRFRSATAAPPAPRAAP